MTNTTPPIEYCPPPPCPPGCDPVDSNNRLIEGTEWDDIIAGSDRSDLIYALGGSDLVFAFGGDDVVRAGTGFDTVVGGVGNDRINGDEDDDFLYGNVGKDRLLGATGNDFLDGGRGRDVLQGDDVQSPGGYDTFHFGQQSSFLAVEGKLGSLSTVDLVTDFEEPFDTISLAWKNVDSFDDLTRYEKKGDTIYAADTDGDGQLDNAFRLDGIVTLAAADVIFA